MLFFSLDKMTAALNVKKVRLFWLIVAYNDVGFVPFLCNSVALALSNFKRTPNRTRSLGWHYLFWNDVHQLFWRIMAVWVFNVLECFNQFNLPRAKLLFQWFCIFMMVWGTGICRLTDHFGYIWPRQCPFQ